MSEIIKLKYNCASLFFQKDLNENVFEIEEFFKPYSAMDLLKSNYFSDDLKEYAYLFENLSSKSERLSK